MLDEDQTGSDSQVRKSGADANRKTIVDDAEDDAAMRAALLASRRFARNPCRQRESVTAQEESKRRGPVSLKRSWGKGTDDVDLARKKKSEEGSTVSTKESDKAVSLGVKRQSEAKTKTVDKRKTVGRRLNDNKARRNNGRARRDRFLFHRKDDHRSEKFRQRQSAVKIKRTVVSEATRQKRSTPTAEQQKQDEKVGGDHRQVPDVEEIVSFLGTDETFITLSTESSSVTDSASHVQQDDAVESKDMPVGNEPTEEHNESNSNGPSESRKDEMVVQFDVNDMYVAGDGDSNDGDRQVDEEGAYLSPGSSTVGDISSETGQLPMYCPAVMGCRSVDEFHCLNRIEEGTYGVVYRAMEKRTGEVVALKRLKMEKEKDGFPITSLREVNMLLKSRSHSNIVNVREIVVGSNMDKIYLVMEYVEHDLKSLMDSMKQPFLVGEVKTLMHQLLSGVHHLHDNWILHRDLKTSNLLLSHRGILKIGDFGLAREYGSPLKPYTPIVVTLWYRAPELLLGVKEYSTAIDLWSVGCIFAELLTLKPLFPGRTEFEQLNRFFKMLGTPNDSIWPGYSELPVLKRTQFAEYPFNNLRKHFGATLSDKGFHLLSRFLTYDPKARICALEASTHGWFVEEPRPVHPSLFPTWPAKSELVKASHSEQNQKPSSGGEAYKPTAREMDKDLLNTLRIRPHQSRAAGFTLKFDAVKF